MNLRSAAGAFSALALASSLLAGCSSVVENATPTPVAFKACLVTTAAGVNDGARNQLAYFGLQQATVVNGSSMSIVQPKSDSVDAVTRAGKKLVSRGCNVVFALGANAVAGLTPLAQGNPDRYFRAIDTGLASYLKLQETNTVPSPANLWVTPLDVRTAYLQAGYLAAATTKTGTVGIIAAGSDPDTVDAVWYFRQGVYQYSSRHGRLVNILGADRAEPGAWTFVTQDSPPGSLKLKTKGLIAGGADVILPVGVNYLPVAQVAAEANAQVIGSDSDWVKQARFSTVKGAILASVVKPIAEVLVTDVTNAMTLAAVDGTHDASLISPQSVTLTEEADVAWPTGIGGELRELASDYSAGNLSVIEEPANS